MVYMQSWQATISHTIGSKFEFFLKELIFYVSVWINNDLEFECFQSFFNGFSSSIPHIELDTISSYFWIKIWISQDFNSRFRKNLDFSYLKKNECFKDFGQLNSLYIHMNVLYLYYIHFLYFFLILFIPAKMIVKTWAWGEDVHRKRRFDHVIL